MREKGNSKPTTTTRAVSARAEKKSENSTWQQERYCDTSGKERNRQNNSCAPRGGAFQGTLRPRHHWWRASASRGKGCCLPSAVAGFSASTRQELSIGRMPKRRVLSLRCRRLTSFGTIGCLTQVTESCLALLGRFVLSRDVRPQTTCNCCLWLSLSPTREIADRGTNRRNTGWSSSMNT